MKIKLFFLFTIICRISNAQSPNWVWAKSSAGSSDDVAKSVDADANGNVFAVGYFASSSIAFGSNILTNTGSGTNDMFIAKYDAAGNVLWAKSAGGSNEDYAVSISIDNSGNAYVAGHFKSSSITFGSNTLTNSGPPYGDFFLVKYDASGNALWARSASGSTSSDAINAVFADNSGNIFATGHFQSASITFGSTTLTNTASPNQDIFVVKYGTSGNVVWAKSIGGSDNDVGSSVATDANGNLFASGYFASSSIAFGSNTLTNASSGTNDMFIAKYDTSGNVVWAKNAGGNNDDYAVSASVDNSGNAYMAGHFKSISVTFGSNTLTNSGPPYGDLFLVKYDASGNSLWARSASGSTSSDAINSVAADIFGGVYITGHFQSSSITFGSATLTNSSSSQEIFVARYDGSGNGLWAKSVGNTANNVGNSVSANSAGSVFVGGQFTGSGITFGSTTLTNSNTGTNDLYVAKLAGTEGIEEIGGLNFSIYPNPFFSQTTIKTDKNLRDAALTVYNLYGQVVKQIKNISGQVITLHRDNLPSGLYFICLTHNNKSFITDKLVITDK